VRIFKSRWFERFARKEGIGDEILREAVARAERGQIDADLGGGVIKQRLPRPGAGRAKGYRGIILFLRGKRAFFVYGFAKSRQANLDAGEEETYKEAARVILNLGDTALERLLSRGDFSEVSNERKVP
jgi:hypothetical protein